MRKSNWELIGLLLFIAAQATSIWHLCHDNYGKAIYYEIQCIILILVNTK